MSRLEARWATPRGALTAFEPSTSALARVADELAHFYNEPHNAELLSNTIVFNAEEVALFWRDSEADGSRAFLFLRDGRVVGDGDFRHRVGGAAELALLIGPRELQGIGLGARYLLMLLTLGFERLDLEQVFVAIRPQNAGSLRLFERAGFARDDSAAARGYAEEDDDVCLTLGRDDFRVRHADAIEEIEVRQTSEGQGA